MSCIKIEKGQKIPIHDLCDVVPEKLCVGFNWGAISKKQLLGLIKSEKPVNIDASVALFGENGKLFDMVYYKRLHSDDHSVSHSGDDKTGDVGEDDGKDNEVITIELGKISESISKIAIFLTSNYDFYTVPYTKIRFFSPTADNSEVLYAEYNIGSDSDYKGKVSMIFGLLERKNNEWDFTSIGEALDATTINDAIDVIQAEWLQPSV